MAYTAGSTILDDEYNLFISGTASGSINHGNNNINSILGSGSGDRGYGQSILSAVGAGTVITASQWATMLNKISTIANHQGSSITAITNPSAGNTIQILSALSGNISTIVSNRNNAASGGSSYGTGGVSSKTVAWNGTANTTQRVTFSSTNHLRYFFNAGGRVAISWARTGGSAEAKNTGWTNLCNACGTIYLTGAAASKTIGGTAYTGTTKIGGSGSPNILSTGTGYYSVNGTVTTFRQYDATSPYTANYIQLDVISSPANPYFELRTSFVDNANTNTDENVDGTLTSTVLLWLPSTTYLTNSWGSPTISTTEAL